MPLVSPRQFTLKDNPCGIGDVCVGAENISHYFHVAYVNRPNTFHGRGEYRPSHGGSLILLNNLKIINCHINALFVAHMCVRINLQTQFEKHTGSKECIICFESYLRVYENKFAK